MARTSTTDQIVEFSLDKFFDGANGRGIMSTVSNSTTRSISTTRSVGLICAMGMAISRSHDEICVVVERKD